MKAFDLFFLMYGVPQIVKGSNNPHHDTIYLVQVNK